MHFLKPGKLITQGIIFGWLFVSFLAWGQGPDDTTKSPCLPCDGLEDLTVPDVIIAKNEKLEQPVPHCKIVGTIGKEISFEILLPEVWNARYVMGGNGGFAGSMQYNPGKLADGYATGGTDTGHQGSGIKADWALNNMERQVNFGHLAVHRTAVTSQEIIRQYYCSPPEFSYFVGCSRGGGQAMVEAQRYPEDFDGIVCGAPAFN